MGHSGAKLIPLTGIQFGVMNCADFPGECPCGSIDFERIVVQRKPNAPITTDFVACLACRAMYFVGCRRSS